MPSTIRFVPNPLAAAEIASSPAMFALILSYADVVAETARAIAPVGDPAEVHDPDVVGGYRDSIISYTTIDAGIVHGVVSSDVRYAAFLEFGTYKMEAFHTLLTALESLSTGTA